ncbi:MAG: biotin--[Clostridium sp.]|nr:biotin--[acetyl-CoA-carboxylase] ligase [Clostridium sp.]
MKQIEKTKLKTKQIGSQIFYYDEIASTNLEAKKHQHDLNGHGMVFLAEQQNQGRGRMGRTWVSPKETGIWMSILLKPDFAPELASQITLPAALATAEAIREITNLDCQIKWPNDIVVNGKKVCGILTEMGTEGSLIAYLIVGIGINVNTEHFPEEIQSVASSLKIEGGLAYEREEILIELLNRMEFYYEKLIADGDLHDLVKTYNSLLINKGKKVKIVGNANTETGEALGIDDTGRLLVRMDDGEERAIVSGEVSVRGLYGYV